MRFSRSGSFESLMNDGWLLLERTTKRLTTQGTHGKDERPFTSLKTVHTVRCTCTIVGEVAESVPLLITNMYLPRLQPGHR